MVYLTSLLDGVRDTKGATREKLLSFVLPSDNYDGIVQVYVVPYLWVNAWLVCITLLQHTHLALPHYTDAEWDWLRGALSTVDRSYGPLDTVFHHIADTHVAHHLFSTMPHYHAQVGNPYTCLFHDA